jgi:hypothetical protein
MRACLPLLLFAALSGCGSGDKSTFADNADAGAALDKQAISKGLLPDPEGLALSGRFETRSELGIDKFCAINSGSDSRFGMLAVFGPESKCEGQGRAKFEGITVSLEFEGKKSCSFDAEYDGIAIRFPGNIGPGCASYCSPRASMSGTQYFLVEQGNESARRVLGRDIERLCP